MSLLIGAEAAEGDVRTAHRQGHLTRRPETVEIREPGPFRCGALQKIVIEPAQPLFGVAPLREGIGDAEAIRDAGKDIVIVPRRADRLDDLLHRRHHLFIERITDVVALIGRCRRQHQIGVLGRRRPPGLMHDDGLGPLPGRDQAVQILVVMEGVAATPVDQSDVGIGLPPPIVVEGEAGILEHVHHPGDRDEGVDRIFPLRQRRAVELGRGAAGVVEGADAEADASARQADATQHGGQGERHPERLLAVLRPLQPQRHGDVSALVRHASRQVDDGGGLEATDRGRPGRRLRLAVALAREVGAEALETDAMAIEERLVVAVFGYQPMGDAQHQGGVAVGTRGQPLGLEKISQVIAQRADVDERHAVVTARREGLAQDVAGQAARFDLGVAQRRAAEHDHQFAGLGDDFPRRAPA